MLSGSEGTLAGNASNSREASGSREALGGAAALLRKKKSTTALLAANSTNSIPNSGAANAGGHPKSRLNKAFSRFLHKPKSLASIEAAAAAGGSQQVCSTK